MLPHTCIHSRDCKCTRKLEPFRAAQHVVISIPDAQMAHTTSIHSSGTALALVASPSIQRLAWRAFRRNKRTCVRMRRRARPSAHVHKACLAAHADLCMSLCGN